MKDISFLFFYFMMALLGLIVHIFLFIFMILYYPIWRLKVFILRIWKVHNKPH